MTYFQNDDGDVLEMVDEFSLKRSCANLFAFEIKGDYSISFQMPNTSDVRNKLGYYSNVQTPNPAFSSSTWNLVKNGNIIGRGKMVIERDDYDNLYLFFASGNSNWLTLITGDVKDLDFDEYSLAWIETVVDTRKASTSGFVFPFVDWAYHGGHDISNVYHNTIVDKGADYINKSYTDFYPCFYLKNAVLHIITHFGLKLGGDILTDQLYNSLIITPDAGRIARASKFSNDRHTILLLSAADPFTTVAAKIDFDLVVSDGALLCWDGTNLRYVANKNCTIQVDVKLTLSATKIFTTYLYNNGASVDSAVNAVSSTVITVTLYADVVTGDYLEIYGSASVGTGNVLADSKAEFKPKPFIQTGPSFYSPTTDILRASDILPSMKAMDFIKMVAQYFCCIVTYDPYTETVSMNKLDNYRLENAVDWSEFLQAYENNYAIKTAENNYIRVHQPDDIELDVHNNTEKKFGEALLIGSSQAKENNDLFTIPFGGAVDKIGDNNYNILQPSIDLVGLKDDGAPFPYTSVSDMSPQARFNGTGFPIMVAGQVVRLYGAGGYDGYGIVDGGGTSTTTAFRLIGVNYINTFSGFFYLQTINFKNGQSRLLYFTPNLPTTDFSKLSSGFVLEEEPNGATDTYTSVGWAYYSKPITSYNISSYKQGVNTGALNAQGNDVSTQNIYFKYISRILNSPYVKVQLYLPEADYAAFQFLTFITLIDGDNRKYYLVDSIENYKDSATMCQANLLLISSTVGGQGGAAEAFSITSAALGATFASVFGASTYTLQWSSPPSEPIAGWPMTVPSTFGATAAMDAGTQFVPVTITKTNNGGLSQGTTVIKFFINSVLKQTLTFTIGQSINFLYTFGPFISDAPLCEITITET